MKLDDLQPKDLYGDLNMTIKQSIDLAKEGMTEHRISNGSVQNKASSPLFLQIIKGLAVAILVIGFGWNLLSDHNLYSLIVILISLTVLVSVYFAQYIYAR